MKLSERQTQKIKTYIGFAFKSRACILGTDNILSAGKYNLVLVDEGLSENAQAKIQRHATEHGVDVISLENLVEVAPKIGVKALAIKNKELSKAIQDTLAEGRE